MIEKEIHFISKSLNLQSQSNDPSFRYLIESIFQSRSARQKPGLPKSDSSNRRLLYNFVEKKWLPVDYSITLTSTS